MSVHAATRRCIKHILDNSDVGFRVHLGIDYISPTDEFRDNLKNLGPKLVIPRASIDGLNYFQGRADTISHDFQIEMKLWYGIDGFTDFDGLELDDDVQTLTTTLLDFDRWYAAMGAHADNASAAKPFDIEIPQEELLEGRSDILFLRVILKFGRSGL